MALSAEESQKLLDAIQNLNVSAEVIQEVLQLIRNAGHTGAVDIAEHDNDPNAHANVPNLCKLVGGQLFLGSTGEVAPVYWSLLRPARIVRNALHSGWDVYLLGETKGGQQGTSGIKAFIGATTADNKAMSLDEVQATGKVSMIVTQLRGSFHTSDWEQADQGLTGSFAVMTGASTRSGDISCTSGRITGATSKEAPNVIMYELGPDAILPWTGITASLGTATYPFDNAYLKNAATVTSDERLKTSVEDVDGDKALALLKVLRPVTFSMRVGKTEVVSSDEDGNPTDIKTTPGVRRHAGLIAQEVRTALEDTGEDPAANGLWCLADPADPDSVQMLRYEELIAPMLKVIQMQQERIEALEAKLK